MFLAWVLALVPSVWLILSGTNNLTGGGFEVAGSQSLRVQHAIEEHFPTEGASPLALVAAPRPAAGYDDMRGAVDELRRIAAEVPSVSVVENPTQPPPQPGRPYVLTLALDFENTGAVDVARQLRAKVGIHDSEPGQTADGSVRLYVIGQGALGAAAQTSTKHDIAAAERWNLPVVLMVLVAVFGSLAAAAIPLTLAVCTVTVTMGIVYLLSELTTMSVFVSSTVSMFGIALAVDYSLFILMRFREELRQGRSVQQATDAAMTTSGLAVTLSGMTVIASLTGIYLIDTPVLASMATGAILAVAMSVLTSVTLTPAILATFGRAIARRSPVLQLSRRPAGSEATQFWGRWVRKVMRRPWLSATAAALFLVLLAAPVVSMVLGNSMLRQFPPSHEIRGGVNAAAEALGPGALGPVRVLVSFPGGDAGTPANAGLVDALRSEMSRAIDIVSVPPPVTSDDGRSVLLSGVLAVDPEDLAARNAVDRLRDRLPTVAGEWWAGNGGPDDSAVPEVDVGGPTALIKDFDDRVDHTVIRVLLFVSTLAFVMLLLSIRSVFLAVKGVLMTLLSVAAAYGSLVVVFQWGWFSWIGFEPLSSIDSTVPPLVLAVTFGLSMDYEIFLLARIRERFLVTGDTRDAVAHGVSTSARTITSAALIMIAVFIGFAFAGMPLVAQLGVACAVAIAVDATVVRLVLVPALMAIAEQWNWWLPPWLDKILPSVDFEKPMPRGDGSETVAFADDLPGLPAPSGDVRMVVKGAARLQRLAPGAVAMVDPLAFTADSRKPRGDAVSVTDETTKIARPVHPVTVWRSRLAVALDALDFQADDPVPELVRSRPVETAFVQLPTGDRLKVPTGAETLRLKGYLVLARNKGRDYAEFAELVECTDPETVATVLTQMDRYYSGIDSPTSDRPWVTSLLVRQLADPNPDDGFRGDPVSVPDWENVRKRCLSVAVAMLEEAR
ncbi:hypothetical protein MBRU_10125 [Mycolicibacterium brumae DSM 44177]|nr:hypothetical protein MBRU_10125 [Mycolicibacterium brumae DSM 44177]